MQRNVIIITSTHLCKFNNSDVWWCVQATERLVDGSLVEKLEEPTLAVRGMPQMAELSDAAAAVDFVVRVLLF